MRWHHSLSYSIILEPDPPPLYGIPPFYVRLCLEAVLPERREQRYVFSTATESDRQDLSVPLPVDLSPQIKEELWTPTLELF